LSIRRSLIAAVLAALAAPGAGSAGVREDALVVRSGLVHALQNGWLEQRDAERYWLIVERFRSTRTLLPGPRRREVDGVFHDVSLHAAHFTPPRALAVFSMLEANTRYFGTHGVPGGKVDVIGRDGVLYRSFPGHGLQFHPLGNVARLNGMNTAKDAAGAEQLAEALANRLVRRNGGAIWEYYFAFGGGHPPWTSGMVQAVGAHVLARFARVFARPEFVTLARLVYREAPRHLIPLRAGPWTRLYSFSGIVVLNAHLQSVVSLRAYAKMTGDAGAKDLAMRELRVAARLLPRFDTGSWSLYSLGGAAAPMKYHLYVVDLLRTLAAKTGAPIWSRYATRFTRYATRRGAVATLGRPDDGQSLSTWPN
jgi:hypothetical protein